MSVKQEEETPRLFRTPGRTTINGENTYPVFRLATPFTPIPKRRREPSEGETPTEQTVRTPKRYRSMAPTPSARLPAHYLETPGQAPVILSPQTTPQPPSQALPLADNRNHPVAPRSFDLSARFETGLSLNSPRASDVRNRRDAVGPLAAPPFPPTWRETALLKKAKHTPVAPKVRADRRDRAAARKAAGYRNSWRCLVCGDTTHHRVQCPHITGRHLEKDVSSGQWRDSLGRRYCNRWNGKACLCSTQDGNGPDGEGACPFRHACTICGNLDHNAQGCMAV